MATRLLVVGGGNMGSALVEGLVGAGSMLPADIVVAEASAARRAELAESIASRFSGLRVVEEPVACDGAVVAVKPGDVEGVCRALGRLGANRVLSIAAGVKLSQLATWCGDGAALLRAMPNRAASVRASATALSAGPGAGAPDVAWARELMASVGSVVEVPEHWMDAVTGLSGSGPAYLFLVVEAMADAGVLVGLPREVAASLVCQTLLGSARLLVETGQSAEELRAAVTSPGGTTAAGLRQLEARAVRSAFVEAVVAATERSRELSG
jgi:pyrroline-5-carboxylate reductase